MPTCEFQPTNADLPMSTCQHRPASTNRNTIAQAKENVTMEPAKPRDGRRTILDKKSTILIADDSSENIIALAELLRGEYKIKAASGGQKALDIAFSANPPDLIILDVDMPDLDGFEVCKKLKAAPLTRKIPVIFLTGKQTEEDELYGFSLGAVDYIKKPFNPVIICKRIGTHADLKKHQDYLESVSYLDGLTGIANRRRLQEYLHMAWEHAQRFRSPLTAIMADIDFF
jgi:PleD family two-component response regulator